MYTSCVPNVFAQRALRRSVQNFRIAKLLAPNRHAFRSIRIEPDPAGLHIIRISLNFQTATLYLPSMKTFRDHALCLLACGFCEFRTIAAVVSTPSDFTSIMPNISSISDYPLNATSLGAIDPTKFRVGTRYGSLRLPATSVLMNAVDVMVQLALEDWEGQMNRKSFRLDLPRYSQIEIIINPWDESPTATIHPGFAILGLFEVILNILTDPTSRFKTVQSQFYYNGNKVGWLLIRRVAGTVSTLSSNSSQLSEPTNLTFSDATQLLNVTDDEVDLVGTNVLSTPAWEDSHLEVSYFAGLETLTVYELFFAVMAQIKMMAPHDSNAQIRDFTLDIDAPPITTAGHPIITSFKNVGSPPRTAANPPYFKWEWLIKAFGQLPQHMLTSGFKELYLMGLKVDGTAVGDGYLVRKQSNVLGPAASRLDMC